MNVEKPFLSAEEETAFWKDQAHAFEAEATRQRNRMSVGDAIAVVHEEVASLRSEIEALHVDVQSLAERL